MAKSLFAVQVIPPGSSVVNPPVNVLAQPVTGPPAVTALQGAIDAAVTAAGTGSTFVGAVELGQRPADYTITAAVSPATDGTPKAMYQVSYRPGSGTGGSSPAPVLVLSWPQTSSGVTTAASDLAIACASANGGGAVPNQANLLGTVGIDAT